MEAALLDIVEQSDGGSESEAQRKPPASVKLLLLDLMRDAGPEGATSAGVVSLVQATVPNVARETVRSLLSRLKVDGALVYVGDRYYEKKFAPNDNANGGQPSGVER